MLLPLSPTPLALPPGTNARTRPAWPKIKLRWQRGKYRSRTQWGWKNKSKALDIVILHISLNNETTPSSPLQNPPKLGSVRHLVVVRAGLAGGDACFAHSEKPTSPVSSDSSGDLRDLPWRPPSPSCPLDSGIKSYSKRPFLPDMRPIPRHPRGAFPGAQLPRR